MTDEGDGIARLSSDLGHASSITAGVNEGYSRAPPYAEARWRPGQALCRASRRIVMAWATAARVAWVPLSGLSIMKSWVMPS